MGEWLHNYILGNEQVISKIIYSVILLIGAWILKTYTTRVMNRLSKDTKMQGGSKRIVSSVYSLIYILGLLVIWFQSSTNFLSFLALFTGGLAIALRDFIMNIAGGIYIIWARPFMVGDRVEIAGQIGDVIDVGLLQFSMLEVGNRIMGEQSTGRIINIPNVQIFNVPLANYEKGFRYIWHEITVPLKLESDWELAKELIYTIVDEHGEELIDNAKKEIDQAGKKYLIYYANLTPIVYTEVKESHISLTLRYLCEPRQARMTEHIIWESILTTFKPYESIQIGKS